jgi:hypothetical protein
LLFLRDQWIITYHARSMVKLRYTTTILCGVQCRVVSSDVQVTGGCREVHATRASVSNPIAMHRIASRVTSQRGRDSVASIPPVLKKNELQEQQMVSSQSFARPSRKHTVSRREAVVTARSQSPKPDPNVPLPWCTPSPSFSVAS